MTLENNEDYIKMLEQIVVRWNEYLKDFEDKRLEIHAQIKAMENLIKELKGETK